MIFATLIFVNVILNSNRNRVADDHEACAVRRVGRLHPVRDDRGAPTEGECCLTREFPGDLPIVLYVNRISRCYFDL